jgi:DNA-binding NarL/FixJ family response regulator
MIQINSIKKLSLLIAECDPFFTNLYKSEIEKDISLRLLGISNTGSEAITFLETNLIDVLICDLNLPDMRGIDIIAKAKSLNPQVEILVITEAGGQNEFYECLNFEVKVFIQKNELRENFVNVLHSIKEGYAAISPTIAKAFIQKNWQNERLQTKVKNPLSKRELEVLTEMSTGLSIKQIARKFSLSPYTVSDYTKSIYRKLKVRSNTQAISEIKKMGWLN